AEVARDAERTADAEVVVVVAGRDQHRLVGARAGVVLVDAGPVADVGQRLDRVRRGRAGERDGDVLRRGPGDGDHLDVVAVRGRDRQAGDGPRRGRGRPLAGE